MLACGSIRLGPGTALALLALLGAWGTAIILVFINFFLVLDSERSWRFTVLNWGSFLIYFVLMSALLTGGFVQSGWLSFLAIVLPVLVMVHAVYLFYSRRTTRKKSKDS